MICDYGCKNEAKFSLKNGKNCCSKRPAGCPILKQINSNVAKISYKHGKRKSGKEKYKDLSQESKDKMLWSKGKNLTPNEAIFIKNSLYSGYAIKNRVLKNDLIEYKCQQCKLTDKWMNKSIVLDLDHIDGDNTNNELENLRFLCPNCHSQTDTYKGRNKNNGKQKVTDKELLTAYKKHATIRKALLSLGLAAKGGNYIRMKAVIEKDEIGNK